MMCKLADYTRTRVQQYTDPMCRFFAQLVFGTQMFVVSIGVFKYIDLRDVASERKLRSSPLPKFGS